MSRMLTGAWAAVLAVAMGSGGLWAQEPAAKREGPPKKFRDFAEVTKDAAKIDGLFTLHRKDDHLYAEIKPQQLDQPMICPIAIAKGMASAGQPLNFGDEWVLVFKRVGDKIQLIRRNVHYKATTGTPLEKAVRQNYTDSVLLALPILSINPGGQSVVIDLADIFLTDFAGPGIGSMDRNRSSWHKVKAFPNNLELQVEATFNAGRMGGSSAAAGDAVADPRGITLVIHYSLVKLPDGGYRTRLADDRVGQFLSAVKDFGQENTDTPFVRQINRWRLEKSEPKKSLSTPKKQIVWWVEDTVPHEYRPYVEEGILEWNKAFEKIGFRHAIDVRWQDSTRDDFDPEDINYCTFRWITSPSTYAMSCLRANPITGEMIDGDVIFDASFVRHWKQDYAVLTGTAPASAGGGEGTAVPLDLGEVISPIMAAKYQSGILAPSEMRRAGEARIAPGGPDLHLVPAEWGDAQALLQKRLSRGRMAGCEFNSGLRPEMTMAALALADAGKAEEAGKLPEEFLGQMIKEVVMHEVGHSLGLRHNFHASTMLTPEQLNDTSITRVKGQSGSVMDYNPINIAPKGQKQGDYVTTTLGPYDYWAIEYAYKPIDGDEAGELKKIAARSPDPDLAYATDEDMVGNDPFVNKYDLGSDPSRFAMDRIALAAQMMKDLDSKLVKDGESWARARSAFATLLQQWGNGAYVLASFVGGQNVSRDHKGDKGSRDPIVPIPASKQREALKVLNEQVLADKAFRFSPALLRKLAGERWYHWGNGPHSSTGGGVDYPIHERVLAIQKIVLNQCLAADTLGRLQNQELMADETSEPLKMSEVFRTLTDGIWSELAEPSTESKDKASPVLLSTMRRNLQREHLRRLGTMVVVDRSNRSADSLGFMFFFGSSTIPADARSLARLHLKEIDGRIGKVLARKDVQVDDTTRAHLEECHNQVAKILDATMTLNSP